MHSRGSRGSLHSDAQGAMLGAPCFRSFIGRQQTRDAAGHAMGIVMTKTSILSAYGCHRCLSACMHACMHMAHGACIWHTDTHIHTQATEPTSARRRGTGTPSM